MNIYITGVGGQGIGMLSEILIRAADHAGLHAMGVDTHGLAQRGGIVISQLRIGEEVHSPLIERGKADIVIAMERNEALRAAGEFLRDGGSLLYYDTVWQPFDVRYESAAEVSLDALHDYCLQRGIRVLRAFEEDLDDPRSQNIVLLALTCSREIIQGITCADYRNAIDDLMKGAMLEANRKLFDRITELPG